MEKQGPPQNPSIATGPSVDPSLRDFSYENIREGIVEQDIRRDLPPIEGTSLVLQVNARDQRNPDSPHYGEITEEAKENTRLEAKEYFLEVIKKLPPKDREQIQILIVASDSSLIVPGNDDLNSPHKRGLETAVEVMAGAKEALLELGLPDSLIINHSLPAIQNRSKDNAQEIGEFTQLEPTSILRESPEFLQLLIERHGSGAEIPFWSAYEDDVEKEDRERLNAEGPEDIAERISKFVKTMSRYGRTIHRYHPNKRLIIWAVSHYDSLSPYIKKDILKMPLKDELRMNKGSGITVDVASDGNLSSTIRGIKHDIGAIY